MTRQYRVSPARQAYLEKAAEAVRACAARGLTRAETAAHLDFTYERVVDIGQRHQIQFAKHRNVTVRGLRRRSTGTPAVSSAPRTSGPETHYRALKAQLRWGGVGTW